VLASFILVPTYEYKCPNGHLFEIFKRIADPQPEKCAVCGASPVETVLYPVPVHFRGSGFYSTDYGRKSRQPSKDGGSGESSSGSSSGSESGGSSGSDSGSSGSGDSSSGESKKAAEA
jgi:putative FmdB family regulatory protein